MQIIKGCYSISWQSTRFICGDTNSVWARCDHIFSGRADTGTQEHLYFETQEALVIPSDNSKLKVYSSSQAPTAVQRTISEVLNIPMNLIEVDVTRIGGGFDGKEDQANMFAALAALAANKLQKPVKLVLSRTNDMQITGKRHPYSVDFKIGLSKDLHIPGYEATFYQNAGAFADLSPAILESTLFHVTKSYFIPNVKAKGISCKTNLPPNTAFRGFGGPQAMFAIESAIYHAANSLNISPMEIQGKNLIENGQTFPYGLTARNNQTSLCWNNANDTFLVPSKKSSVISFNSENKFVKKGLALMPVCFGISFTSAFMYQANALVHIYIYTDGRVFLLSANMITVLQLFF